MKYSTIIMALSIVLMTGCVTTYKETPSSQAHAIIEGAGIENNTAASFFGHKAAYILEINDQPVSDFWKSHGAKRRINPGETKVLLEAGMQGQMTAYTIVTFLAEAYKHYYANYKAEGMDVTLFVTEKDSGDIVGEAMTTKVKKNVSTPMIIPIVY